jgi:hypothetical protein
VTEIFTKALRRKDQAGKSAIDPTADNNKEETEGEKANSGKITNLISGKKLQARQRIQLMFLCIIVDTFRLSEVCAYLFFIWPEMPLQIILILYILFKVIGLSAAAGVSVSRFNKV